MPISHDHEADAFHAFEQAGWESNVAAYDAAFARLTSQAIGPLLETVWVRDGTRLLMTNADGRGAVWDVDPESWLRRACTIAHRTLTNEEWQSFLPGRPYEPACAE